MQNSAIFMVDFSRECGYLKKVLEIYFKGLIMGDFEKWLFAANSALGLSVLGLLITIACAYPLAGALAMPVQIAAHIGTLIFAVGIKVAYVARLVFLSRLGRPVH